jgi:excisionase family DNA binding protein
MKIVNRELHSEGLLRVEQVASLLCVSYSTVRRMVQRKELTAPIALGRSIRWHRSAVDAFISDSQAARRR